MGDRPTPLKVRSAAAAAPSGGADDGPFSGLGRYVRLDGLQRANALVLAVLLAAGYGRSSAGVLDLETMQTAQLAASVLCVAHLLIAGYGAFLASQAPGGKQNPVLWFVKLALTGVGGLVELKKGEK